VIRGGFPCGPGRGDDDRQHEPLGIPQALVGDGVLDAFIAQARAVTTG
jgi:hypothetical protein